MSPCSMLVRLRARTQAQRVCGGLRTQESQHSNTIFAPPLSPPGLWIPRLGTLPTKSRRCSARTQRSWLRRVPPNATKYGALISRILLLYSPEQDQISLESQLSSRGETPCHRRQPASTSIHPMRPSVSDRSPCASCSLETTRLAASRPFAPRPRPAPPPRAPRRAAPVGAPAQPPPGRAPARPRRLRPRLRRSAPAPDARREHQRRVWDRCLPAVFSRIVVDWVRVAPSRIVRIV